MISTFKAGTGVCGGCGGWDPSGFGGDCGGRGGLSGCCGIFSYYLCFIFEDLPSEALSSTSSISSL